MRVKTAVMRTKVTRSDLVDSEAHEDSSDSEDAENDKSLDEVHFFGHSCDHL